MILVFVDAVKVPMSLFLNAKVSNSGINQAVHYRDHVLAMQI